MIQITTGFLPYSNYRTSIDEHIFLSTTEKLRFSFIKESIFI